MAGFKFTAAPDSVKNYLQFDESNVLINNSGTQNCTTYTFAKDTSAGFHGILTMASTYVYPNWCDVTLSNDTLVLYPHLVADGFAYYYARSLKTFTWCVK